MCTIIKSKLFFYIAYKITYFFISILNIMNNKNSEKMHQVEHFQEQRKIHFVNGTLRVTQ